MKQVLIVLRGAPASGKSSIAKNLRDFGKKIIWLKVDNFKDFFSEVSEEALSEANKAGLATLNYLLDKGYSVIFEGIFKNPDWANNATKLAQQKNIPVFIYQLSCSLKTLQERDQARPGIKEGCRKPLGDKTIEFLYREVESKPIANTIKLDTNKLSIEECIKTIQRHLN